MLLTLSPRLVSFAIPFDVNYILTSMLVQKLLYKTYPSSWLFPLLITL